MLSIKVKFRKSSLPDKEGSIFFQFIHRRKVKNLATPYHIYPDEWDYESESIKAGANVSRQNYLRSIRDQLDYDLQKFYKIINEIESRSPFFSIEEIIMKFQEENKVETLFSFFRKQILYLSEIGKKRTSENYSVTLNSLKACFHKDINFSDIDERMVLKYECFLRKRNVCANTLSFYMRVWRAIYNKAVGEGLASQKYPFRKVYTGIAKTRKRALPIEILKKIKGIDLSCNEPLDYARDMFLLSFYLQGMSFIDMAFLRKKDLRNGHIVYFRKKTGQQLNIKWTKEMKSIVSKYSGNKKYSDDKSCYLLPIINGKGGDVLSGYRNRGMAINRGLKKIAYRLSINFPLTLYVARHSWATTAHSQGVPLNVISEGLGHDSERTTKIYLASLDTRVIDTANKIVIKAIS